MNTATAKSIQPDNRSFTPREAISAIDACSPDCACAIAWRAVEEFGMSLEPPRVPKDGWIAVWPKAPGPFYAFGDTPIEAVRDLLEEIGGAA